MRLSSVAAAVTAAYRGPYLKKGVLERQGNEDDPEEGEAPLRPCSGRLDKVGDPNRGASPEEAGTKRATESWWLQTGHASVEFTELVVSRDPSGARARNQHPHSTIVLCQQEDPTVRSQG